MSFPEADDYIDIHTHGSGTKPGIFSVETLMVHEDKVPGDIKGIAFSAGIHPWYLTGENQKILLQRVKDYATHPSVIAVGEAGFDKIRGASPELQRQTFREQVIISEDMGKPLVIHCVKAWDELLEEHKALKPSLPWMVHGFRGKTTLAGQLLSRGFYLSLWYSFVFREEAAGLIRSIPEDRLFLETDGSDVDIRDIYVKVASFLGYSTEQLKLIIHNNFGSFYNRSII